MARGILKVKLITGDVLASNTSFCRFSPKTAFASWNNAAAGRQVHGNLSKPNFFYQLRKNHKTFTCRKKKQVWAFEGSERGERPRDDGGIDGGGSLRGLEQDFDDDGFKEAQPDHVDVLATPLDPGYLEQDYDNQTAFAWLTILFLGMAASVFCVPSLVTEAWALSSIQEPLRGSFLCVVAAMLLAPAYISNLLRIEAEHGNMRTATAYSLNLSLVLWAAAFLFTHLLTPLSLGILPMGVAFIVSGAVFSLSVMRFRQLGLSAFISGAALLKARVDFPPSYREEDDVLPFVLHRLAADAKSLFHPGNWRAAIAAFLTLVWVVAAGISLVAPQSSGPQIFGLPRDPAVAFLSRIVGSCFLPFTMAAYCLKDCAEHHQLGSGACKRISAGFFCLTLMLLVLTTPASVGDFMDMGTITAAARGVFQAAAFAWLILMFPAPKGRDSVEPEARGEMELPEGELS